MTIVDRKHFTMGLVMSVLFFVILGLIFSPIFPGKHGDGSKANGLDFSDNLFNQLSKGSSYFIPRAAKLAKDVEGTAIDLSVPVKAENAEDALKIFTTVGAQVELSEGNIKVAGDLGKILAVCLADSDSMYNNDGATIKGKYGIDEKRVMEAWHGVLGGINKSLTKSLKITEAKAVNEVMKKGIEPAYNFYGIQAEKVIDRAPLMIGLLVFYVFYTMWWGFSIFYLFEGIGLILAKKK